PADDDLHRVHAAGEHRDGGRPQHRAGRDHLAGAGRGPNGGRLDGGRGRIVMARRSRAFYVQLAFTLSVCAFLIVPVGLSVTAGLTANFFQGVKSGLTVRWVVEVWRLYSETIYRSLMIAVACLGVDLMVGVPAAYVLARWHGWATRLIEELLV